MALEGAPEVEGPEDEAPAANLGAVKGLANLALALADPLAVLEADLAVADLALADLAVADLALADLAEVVLALADLAEVVFVEVVLAGGCCDPDGVSSFLDLAGALQTYKET